MKGKSIYKKINLTPYKQFPDYTGYSLLNERELVVIRATLGIHCKELTLQQLADAYDVTPQMIRNIKE